MDKMNEIKILPKDLADKIAAGEVVERPASVVKELVENSLDAASTSIEVIISDAGCKMIKVIDNGRGMHADDLKLAPQRHATSKITSAADLSDIDTLGFRGEALASISAVTLLTITSCGQSETTAWTLKIEGGVFKDMIQTARTAGTTVEVRNLFFNTPARLKFLKSKATEMFHIIKIITELSLSYSQVSFKLINNDEEIINLDRSRNRLDRIKVLLGEEIAEQLIPISFEIAPLKINGFISKAGFGQTNRKNQYIFVNQRPVIDKTIFHAITQGYHTFLLEKQFPPVLIFIETPPELIDVNVHPTKREIRFREGNVLHDILVKLMKDTLTAKEGLPKLAFAQDVEHPPRRSDYMPKTTESFSRSYAPELIDKELSGVSVKDDKLPSLWEEESKFKGKLLGNYLQLKNTYIVVPEKDGMIIVDQHAAHERVLFDELLASFKKKAVEKQKLLLPVTLNFNKAQMLLMRENISLFQELGFDIEEFGEQTFAVHSYPAVLDKVNISTMFENMIAEIAELSLSVDIEKRVVQLLAPIACHAAVRANEKLSAEQITSLLKRLWKTNAPYTCPHGRPTLIKISEAELEKRFKRK